MAAEVAVFIADVRDHDCEALTGWLTAVERARLAMIGHAGRRAQFILGRLLLHWGLRHRYGTAAASWCLSAGPGRPSLAGVGAPEISLSHARELVLCAVAEVAVGIDVEYCRRRDFPTLIGHLAGMEERERFLTMSEEDQYIAFYRMWTLREARFKLGGLADGVGHIYFQPRVDFQAAVAVRSVEPIILLKQAPVQLDLATSPLLGEWSSAY